MHRGTSPYSTNYVENERKRLHTWYQRVKIQFGRHDRIAQLLHLENAKKGMNTDLLLLRMTRRVFSETGRSKHKFLGHSRPDIIVLEKRDG